MAGIVLYSHVLKYLGNKAIESIKLVVTVFIDKQNIVSVHGASCLKWYSVCVFCVKYW